MRTAADSVSEAFRIVRTNMDFMRVKEKNMQVVMFTSFNPGAGKTFVSINLAMSFALTHKKVVLVDLDIRKGTLSSHVQVSDMGVTNYLSGRIDNVDEIIQKGELYDKLDITMRSRSAQPSRTLVERPVGGFDRRAA